MPYGTTPASWRMCSCRINVPDQSLCIAGETCVPEMKLAHLQTLPKLKVGAMGPTAALFLHFGAAVAESDCVLRLSTGATKSLRALRENNKVSFQMYDISQLWDRNVMLGALALNAEQYVTVMVGRLLWSPLWLVATLARPRHYHRTAAAVASTGVPLRRACLRAARPMRGPRSTSAPTFYFSWPARCRHHAMWVLGMTRPRPCGASQAVHECDATALCGALRPLCAIREHRTRTGTAVRTQGQAASLDLQKISG